MINALLIYPRFPDTFWSMNHALKFVRKRSAFPPMGLLTVAAMLPGDWNLRLIDTNVQPLTHADLAWAHVAMISAMAVQKASAKQIIARCKSAGLKTIAGGPAFTAEPECYDEVDHLVLNEAEITLAPFLADFTSGRAQHLYRSGEFADMTASPLPRWDLIDTKHYGCMSVQYSRGCPFNCEFCDVTALFGRKPRTKSPQQVIAELDTLLHAGWRGAVFFVDDNLIGNKKAARTELLPALIEWQRTHRGTTFNTQASINIADDPATLRLLAQAGFDTVFVGIETPNEQSLAECGKVQNHGRDLEEDVKRIQRAGIQVQGGFIVGFDNDGPSIFQRQIDFIQKSGIVTAMVGMLQALPGTALYKRLANEGRLLNNGNGDNVDGISNIQPIVMSAAALREGYLRILQTIYSPRAYYKRLRTFLREFKKPTVPMRCDRESIAAACRSMLRLGVIGRERVQYWHLLLWTLTRRPSLLPQAMTLAVTGYHFRRICELHIL